MARRYCDLISASSTSSQRNPPVLLRRVLVALVLWQCEGADEFGTCLCWLDHFINESRAQRRRTGQKPDHKGGRSPSPSCIDRSQSSSSRAKPHFLHIP